MSETTSHTESHSESRIGKQLSESVTGIGEGLVNATVMNVGRRLREVAFGVKDLAVGAIVDPLWGVGKGLKEFFTLHWGKAVMEIVSGVRTGVNRALSGVLGVSALPTAHLIQDAVSGTAQAVAGFTGLVGLGGNIGKKVADQYKGYAEAIGGGMGGGEVAAAAGHA